MLEGLDVQPGHTGGCLSPSAARNICSGEVHVEEEASRAQLCHAAPTATARAVIPQLVIP